MQTEIITENNVKIAHITADEVIITDAQSAIELMMSVSYGSGVKNIAISKDLVTEKFFVLSSGVAGEILQKVVNYQFRIAFYGDFSKYTSKPLKDFIYESNKGRDIFFTENAEHAIKKLAYQTV